VNLVLDLIFLCLRSNELDNHTIYLEWRLTSNHISLTITIPIVEKHIQTKKHMIIKDSEEEHIFIKELIEAIRNINTNNISDINYLESIICEFASLMENIWVKNLKVVNITKHSKSWWNTNCSRDLDKYRTSKHIEDWKQFKKTVKITKCTFFDLKIQEISNKRRGLWELMN